MASNKNTNVRMQPGGTGIMDSINYAVADVKEPPREVSFQHGINIRLEVVKNEPKSHLGGLTADLQLPERDMEILILIQEPGMKPKEWRHAGTVKDVHKLNFVAALKFKVAQALDTCGVINAL